MTEFYDYVKEQKRTASGARHRVCGSKSKRCGLPSDHMTQAQWKKKNGEVVSVSLNEPMNWAAFSSLSPDLKKEYIQKCIDAFGCGMSDLSRMFGVHVTTVKRCFQKDGIWMDGFHPGKRMTKVQKNAFDTWIGAETKLAARQTSETKQTLGAENTSGDDPWKSCSQICLSFDGQLNYAAILQTVYHFAGDRPVHMKIVVDKGENHEQI